MAKVKCRLCGNKISQKDAYIYKDGGKKAYFCSIDEYDKWNCQQDKENALGVLRTEQLAECLEDKDVEYLFRVNSKKKVNRRRGFSEDDSSSIGAFEHGSV